MTWVINLNDLTWMSCSVYAGGFYEQLMQLSFRLFDGMPIARLMDVLRCRAFGFVLYDTSSTGADFDDFYRDHYHVNIIT